MKRTALIEFNWFGPLPRIDRNAEPHALVLWVVRITWMKGLLRDALLRAWGRRL